MISFSSKGEWKKTDKYLKDLKKQEIFQRLERYGQEGVVALRDHTPRDSGATANAWSYKIFWKPETTHIVWYNDNNQGGANVAVLLQYGHATRTGGYVAGQDYINPALRPILDRITEKVVLELKKL